VIHSHFVGTTLVVRLALGRRHSVPRIFQVPGPLHLEHAITRRLELATAGSRDHWIGTCRWTEQAYLRLGIPRERVFLSYYGTVFLAPHADERERVRRELGAGDGAPLVGCNGALVGCDGALVGMVAYLYAPRRLFGERRGLKGHEDFIEAVRRLGVRAAVVGGAWRGADAYERRVRAYGRRRGGDAIRFTGHRSDIPAVYAALDVAVHPSLSENCGAAVESLAAACPTVATRVGGLPDVVIDGETGWLVPPRSPQELAYAIGEALADRAEARRRARSGQALVRRLFAIERTAAEVAGIYRTILRAPQRELRVAV
jgi:glycosyltransferase involved in cell wall biosynthesis